MPIRVETGRLTFPTTLLLQSPTLSATLYSSFQVELVPDFARSQTLGVAFVRCGELAGTVRRGGGRGKGSRSVMVELS